MEGQKFWEVKDVRAANVREAKRYGERWCAAGLYPDLPLRLAVAQLTDSTPPPPLPVLPPTREQQQQARRFAEAGTTEVERIKAALAPRKPPAETKLRAKSQVKAWVRVGRSGLVRRA